MSERAISLANQFTTANDELIGDIQGATDAQVHAICPGDQWPVLVTTRHVAIAYRVVGSWIRRAASGEDIPTTRQQIDEGNARHAQEYATTTREEVLQLLREYSAKTADTIRNLSDEQLSTSVVMGPANGERVRVEQVITYFLIDHIADHLVDIRAAMA